MWPFAPTYPLRPEPPRIASTHPDYDRMWLAFHHDVACLSVVREQAWAHWHRQWAMANLLTWVAWIALLVWIRASLTVTSVACFVWVTFWFWREALYCLKRGHENDTRTRSAERAADELMSGLVALDRQRQTETANSTDTP